MRRWMLMAGLVIVTQSALAAPPVATLTPAATPKASPKAYIFQVQVIEVDAQGRQTVIANQKIQTTGEPAGSAFDKGDGRRFEFTAAIVSSTTNPFIAKPSGSSSAAMPASSSSGTPEELPPPEPAVERRPLPDKVSAPRLPAAALPPADPLPPAPERSAAAPALSDVKAKLAAKVSLAATDIPRRQALRQLASDTGLNLVLDPELAGGARAALDSTIRAEFRDLSADEVLRQILGGADLGYLVKHGVVLVTSAEKSRAVGNELVVEVYGVSELLGPSNGQSVEQRLNALADQLRQQAPQLNWEQGGGSIRPFESTQSLIVKQSAAGHATLKALLDKERQTRLLDVNQPPSPR